MSTSGEQADGRAFRAALSADGRFVAFGSDAANLVPGDTNGLPDIFVRDLRLRRTTRVSISSAGEQANGPSLDPSISADGRYVTFRSLATNLVPGGGQKPVEHVFVHDRSTGRTELVDVGVSGAPASRGSVSAAISGDGGTVEFSSAAPDLVRGDRNRSLDVFVRDLRRQRTLRVSVGSRGEADARSEGASISADGSLVAFRSFATNLVPGDTNGFPDDFVRDWVRGVTRRVNLSSSGEQANAATFRSMLSGDGRRVAFRSRATNLVPGDTNNALDVFVRDLASGTTRRVSVSSEGAQADSGGLDPFVRDNLFMSRPFLSGSGRYVAFGSRATNLVRGDTNGMPDVFVHDLATGTTQRVSVADSGGQADSSSFVSGISADGRVVVFDSFANNLVRGDTNRRRDVFVRVRAGRGACLKPAAR